MDTPRLVAVCGGIGSGKSVICRILRCMGYPVYDCDSRARRLMDESVEIRRTIAERIDVSAIDEAGHIDRARLSAVVFSDPERLAILNTAVHGCVLADLQQWHQSRTEAIAFVETAILYQSGLHRQVDEAWEVSAPEEIRVDRVMSRNAMTREQVEARIRAQQYIPDPSEIHPKTKVIVNDDVTPILPQISSLIRE